MVFIIFPKVYTCDHYLIPEHFHHTQKKPHPGQSPCISLCLLYLLGGWAGGEGTMATPVPYPLFPIPNSLGKGLIGLAYSWVAPSSDKLCPGCTWLAVSPPQQLGTVWTGDGEETGSVLRRRLGAEQMSQEADHAF